MRIRILNYFIECVIQTYTKEIDKEHPWNNPPCTGQGFTGSEEAMIPEYNYGQGQNIKNGAIYKVDKDGNEYLAAIWDKRKARFKSV